MWKYNTFLYFLLAEIHFTHAVSCPDSTEWYKSLQHFWRIFLQKFLQTKGCSECTKCSTSISQAQLGFRDRGLGVAICVIDLRRNVSNSFFLQKKL